MPEVNGQCNVTFSDHGTERDQPESSQSDRAKVFSKPRSHHLQKKSQGLNALSNAVMTMRDSRAKAELRTPRTLQ
jgi:hypothetical protein